jgi:hypothetical protein
MQESNTGMQAEEKDIAEEFEVVADVPEEPSSVIKRIEELEYAFNYVVPADRLGTQPLS